MKEKKYFLLKGIVIIAVFLITLIPILLECHKVEPAEEPANKLGQESVGKAVTAKEPAQKYRQKNWTGKPCSYRLLAEF